MYLFIRKTSYTVAQHWALRILALLTLALVVLAPQPSMAQSGERCFPETGFCISGPIRAYWERNGGLAIFGYPISQLQTEVVEGQTLPVQWFERDRLEDHGAVGVLAGRLGARYLELSNTPWQFFPSLDSPTEGGNCQFFPQTGHSLCKSYLAYWQANGGLERFGYPITEPIYETLEGKKFAVQYFERRRMELHPELPGSPILLGLLGRGVLELPAPIASYPECLADAIPSLWNTQIGKPLGCPILAPLPDAPASTQQFERGVMIWTDTRTPPQPRFKPNIPDIFALINPGPTVQSFDDTWTSANPDTAAATPPSTGLYAPWRGFGKVWTEQAELRAAIGWATEPQAQVRTGDIQVFNNVLLVRIKETGVVYAFGNTNTLTAAQIITP